MTRHSANVLASIVLIGVLIVAIGTTLWRRTHMNVPSVDVAKDEPAAEPIREQWTGVVQSVSADSLTLTVVVPEGQGDRTVSLTNDTIFKKATLRDPDTVKREMAAFEKAMEAYRKAYDASSTVSSTPPPVLPLAATEETIAPADIPIGASVSVVATVPGSVNGAAVAESVEVIPPAPSTSE
ncbi:MAG TPA: hypothetical protein VFS75_00440 [Candidatus Paceibacterota bacterium]|nr:hypothetical protein [Candidatus Paceibacterota bacterium]